MASKAQKFFKQAALDGEAARLRKEIAELEAQQAEQRRIKREELEQELREAQATQAKLKENPYNTLDALLITALAEKFHPQTNFLGKPKKFLDIVFGLTEKSHPAVARTLIQPLMGSGLPFKTFQVITDNYHYLQLAIDDMADDGYQGLVILDHVLYPVRLWMDESEIEWSHKNEAKLALMAAHVTAVAMELKSIKCNVLFFGQSGYSHRMASVSHDVGQIEVAFPDQNKVDVEVDISEVA